MKLFGRELTGFPRALVVLVACLLVSSGLCGVQLLVNSGNSGNPGPILIPLGILELAVMALSAIGIFVVLLCWLAVIVWNRFSESGESDE
jgi:hypothetical protein